MELFEKNIEPKDLPLSVRLRPNDLVDFMGQEHIIGKDMLLRRAIESDKISSLILYQKIALLSI